MLRFPLFHWSQAFLWLFLTVVTPLAAQAASYTYTAGSFDQGFGVNDPRRNNNWHNEFNWEPQGIPTGGDSATLPVNFTVFVNQPITVQNLTLVSGEGNPPIITGGTGQNDLTVTGTLNWSEGQIGANGFGNLIIPAGATMNLLGPDDKRFFGVLNSAGNINWSGTGRFSVGGSSIVNNSGLIDISAEAAYFGIVENPGPILNNSGTIRRSAGAGLFSIAGFDAARTDSLRGTLNNSGIVEVQSGTFQFHGGFSSGTFNVSTGATIQCADSHKFDGNTISGAGIFRISNGSSEANGTITRNGGPLELLGSWRGGFSDTAGSSATLSGTGKLLWQSGSMNGTWTLDTNLHTESSGGAFKTYNGTITNKGTFDWLGGGPIACSITTFVNEGTFNCKAAGLFLADTGINGQTFDNRGTLNTFAGTNTIDDTLISNSGTLNIGGNGIGTLGGSVFSQTATGKLNFDISGTDATVPQFDRLTTRSSTVGGDLNVNFINGFSPQAGDVFRIISGRVSGTFSNVTVQNAGSGKTVVPAYDGGFVDLVTQAIALSINDVAVLEGNTGTGSVNFTVTLSLPASENVTVNYATANGSATAPNDYTAKSGTLTIPAGQTRGIITIPIIGDTLDELDETFFVNLSVPTGASIADTQGRCIIIDNDAAPSVAINDVTISEGNADKNATFTITLSAPSGQIVTVNAIPSNGSARSPFDYTTGGARLVFDAGQVRKTFIVPVKGDLVDEPQENFFVLLSSPVNCSISRGRGVGTINDNDAAPSISIDDVSIGEGNLTQGAPSQRVAAFRLKLSAPSGQVVKVSFATGGGTATADNDYVKVAPTQIAFSTGNDFAYARVLINGDVLNEKDETFNVNLSGASGATIADNQALGTILNDDRAPSLTINDVSITEGSSGTKNLNFTVTLSAASGQTVSVNYATADGSARAPGDYTAKNSTLSFAPGSALTRTISVAIKGDTVVEGNELLYVFLSGASNATIGKARGVGTIANDDTSG